MASGTVQDWLDTLADYGLGDDITSDDLIGIVNSVIQDANTRQAWSFLQATTTVTLQAGQAQVTLPVRFNKAQGLVIDSAPAVLTPERRETIVKKFVGSLTQTGLPEFYYFIGQNLYVYPIPSQNYTAILDYYQDEVVVTAATPLSSLLIPSKHQDVYVLGTLARLFAVEDDTELFSLFSDRYEKKIVDMMEDVSMHQFDMPDRMVDVWDDGSWM